MLTVTWSSPMIVTTLGEDVLDLTPPAPGTDMVYAFRYYPLGTFMPEEREHATIAGYTQAASFLLANAEPTKHQALFESITIEGISAYHHDLRLRLGFDARNNQRERARVSNHITPVWGNMPVGQISLSDVRKVYQALCIKSLAKGSIVEIMGLLGRLLDTAQAKGCIAINPVAEAMRTIKRPSRKPAPRFFPHATELTLMHRSATMLAGLSLALVTEAGLSGKQIEALLTKDCDCRKRRILVRSPVLPGDDPNAPVGRYIKMTDSIFHNLMMARSAVRGLKPRNAHRVIFEGGVVRMLRRMQLDCGIVAETPLTQKDGSVVQLPKYRYDDFVDVAAIGFIEAGRGTKQLSILLDLNVHTVAKRYGKWIEDYSKDHGATTIGATRRASEMIRAKMVQIGLPA